MQADSPKPLYTLGNVTWAPSLYWTLSVYWRTPPPSPELWLHPLSSVLKTADGIVLRTHDQPGVNESRFFLQTAPHHSPSHILQRVKGRLQHLLRPTHPQAFRRNYFIRSVGRTRQDKVEAYLHKQLEHHPLADKRVALDFESHQFEDQGLDLAQIRCSSHGRFQYNLHFVLVNEHRSRVIQDEPLRRRRNGILGTARKKGHLLKAVGMLPDHFHVNLGAGVEESPAEVVLAYLNNLAYLEGMKALFQFHVWVGTVGEYDIGAVKRGTSEDQ